LDAYYHVGAYGRNCSSSDITEITRAAKEVNYMRPTLTINETLSLKRKAGMRASYWDEVTGLESGRYPYGHTTRAARPDGSQGRRIVRIYRADLEAWIKSKEANNAV